CDKRDTHTLRILSQRSCALPRCPDTLKVRYPRQGPQRRRPPARSAAEHSSPDLASPPWAFATCETVHIGGADLYRLTRGVDRMDWRHRAACRDVDPERFFPIGNTRPAILQIEDAKQVCQRLDVTYACLICALEYVQEAGVWGGMSEDERRALKRRTRAGTRALNIRR